MDAKKKHIISLIGSMISSLCHTKTYNYGTISIHVSLMSMPDILHTFNVTFFYFICVLYFLNYDFDRMTNFRSARSTHQ